MRREAIRQEGRKSGRKSVLPFFRAWCACLLLLVPRAAHAECVETGTATVRPAMVDSFPARGTSGYAATLHVVVTHGKGESVLPHGVSPRLRRASA